MNTDSRMFAIKSLDPRASLQLSEYTGMWYVEARINVSDGVFLTGPTEHRSSPQEAVKAFFERLTNTRSDGVVVAHPAGVRREYRWNGAAFVEQHGSIRERAS